MSTLPAPSDALQTSINYFDAGDRDGARYWLDVARELREGLPLSDYDRERFAEMVRLATPTEPAVVPVESDSTIRIPGYIADDATSVISDSLPTSCPSCDRELIVVTGKQVHRNTYQTECEFATAGR